MGLGAAVGTAGTASLLGRWTHLYSQVAAFQQIFLLISRLYMATIVPALLIMPPKREKESRLRNGWQPVLINPSPLMATETGPRSGNESRGAVLRSPDHPLPSESSCALAKNRS
jgi:hypothetical protein